LILAGIYIHIPYCKQACSYCDFYFTTSLKSKPIFLNALEREIEMQRTFLDGHEIETIYFGGATPSMLSSAEVLGIIESIKGNFEVVAGAEITLEANPDNLTCLYLEKLLSAGINRLSIGLQSFKEDELKALNRAHSSFQNIEVIKLAQDTGFKNISVDLIYGTPFSNEKDWEEYIDKVISFHIQHVSCYQLTVEEKTLLYHNIKKGITPLPDDERTERQFLSLIQKMKAAEFNHYEISNFGKPGFYSKHNSSYWKNIPYLGLGPSAHSYNGKSRFYNVSNVHTYTHAIEIGSGWITEEKLSAKELYNDLVLTGLRTEFGVDLPLIVQKLDQSFGNYFQRMAQPYIDNGDIIEKEYNYRLKEESFLFADRISSDLFYI
jgi:oxygen-independent coproporphyrinogen-3 oxidase